MQRRYLAVPSIALALTFFAGVVTRAGGSAADSAATAATADRVARGAYLVRFGLCNDCHTPHKLGHNGLEPDLTRALSGHPSDLVMPAPPVLGPGWAWAGAGTMTSFVGPWGVSFTANLTPDKETGLGNWTEEMFMMALRTGRHEGKGRPILPPMPFQYVASLTDDDLKAVFAYLQSLPPVRNRVPAPFDPAEETAQ
jgi:mono/diheme cytochrome c family protein